MHVCRRMTSGEVLIGHVARLARWGTQKGHPVAQVVREAGFGLNGDLPELRRINVGPLCDGGACGASRSAGALRGGADLDVRSLVWPTWCAHSGDAGAERGAAGVRRWLGSRCPTARWCRGIVSR